MIRPNSLDPRWNPAPRARESHLPDFLVFLSFFSLQFFQRHIQPLAAAVALLRSDLLKGPLASRTKHKATRPL